LESQKLDDRVVDDTGVDVHSKEEEEEEEETMIVDGPTLFFFPSACCRVQTSSKFIERRERLRRRGARPPTFAAPVGDALTPEDKGSGEDRTSVSSNVRSCGDE
jgi:hypothetical protein